MSARIPDHLDTETLRWVAQRDEDRAIELQKLANDRATLINRGETRKASDIDADMHVERCRSIARAALSNTRWLRAAATRIERRRGAR